jgi:YVTN family beta-propeller protein
MESVGLTLTDVAVNPNTSLAYVINSDSNHVSDMNGTKVISNITTEGAPNDIAINPNTNMVYVANELSDPISVINGTRNEIAVNMTCHQVPNHRLI